MSLDLEEETASGSSTSVAKDGTQLVPMDLLDEYWFFHNTLNTRRLPPRSPPSPNKGNESSGVGTSTEKPSEDIRIAPRPLLATPPRVGPDGAGREEVAVPSESSNPKLRHSLSSLDDRHRLQYSSSKRIIAPIPSINSRRRQPRDIRVEGINKYCANQHYLIREANYRKAFQEKKWKSLSDLEFIEVQGFKDLGFVFDEEGTSSASLANVIPGLRDKKAGELGDDKVRRPYLSEAWFVQRSAPPMIKWVDKRSAADMKEQLKFWARAVACNVRQEC
uniref:Uncharacterized protein LOC105040958 n=2 Tax=Elaeis guineensis var. tenera TaxID=51953 RepID=A0A6I9QVI9_ELAGV|nr:uncharacterized protein LOC105040958 [Elaeis guineensis]